jgi:peptidyl-prolyl cis-trans isomerase A (cyclophilin A)
MRTANIRNWKSVAGGLALLALACSDPAPPPGAEPGADQDGAGAAASKDPQHFLADKPLKLFDEQDSQRWKRLEAIGAAEQRADAYKDRHSMVAEPTSPDPLRGLFVPLEKALEGLEGDGPPVATIETTAGTITCELLTERSPAGVAHFVGLARGLRPWWDGTVGKWSTAPFYRATPVYKVVPGEAFYSGCPMALGFAEVGFRALVPKESYAPASDALTLAMFAGQRLPSLGPQFLITAKPGAKIAEKTVPIGRCESSNVVQQIVNQEVTGKGIPLAETTVVDIAISR